MGTVTGAYLSGKIVAEKILRLYGVPEEELRMKKDEDGALPTGGVGKSGEEVGVVGKHVEGNIMSLTE
jgi:hypothetical protein